MTEKQNKESMQKGEVSEENLEPSIPSIPPFPGDSAGEEEERAEKITGAEAVLFVTSRTFKGALVGIAIACIYALYSPPAIVWVGGGMAYGVLTACAFILGNEGSRQSLKYLNLDGFIAAFILVLFALLAPQTILSVIMAAFLSQTFWSGVYLGIIAVFLLARIVLVWKKTKEV